MASYANYTDFLVGKLLQGREDGLLCDVEISVDSKTFSAHQIVLASTSDYFKTMFTTNMKERYSGKVVLKEVTADSVEQVLDFMYTGKIELTIENLDNILKTAHMLMVESLLEALSKFLVESLNTSNALALRKTSQLFQLKNLNKLVEEYIIENFDDICVQDAFLNDMSVDDMQLYLTRDKIGASEDELVACLFKWVNASLEERKQDFLPLFNLIRLQCVSLDFLLDTLREDEWVVNSQECQYLVKNAMHFHIRPNDFEKQERRKGRLDVCLLTDTYEILSLKLEKDTVVEEIPKPPVHVSYKSAVAFHQGKVFFIGGNQDNSNMPSNAIVSFDGKVWKKDGSLVYARSYASAVCLNGKIYVFGGEATGRNLVETECIFEGKSKHVAALNDKYYRRCGTAVVAKNEIYYIGGAYTNANYETTVTNVTTCVNVESSSMINIGELNHGRSGCGACAIDNKIFVFGGSNSSGNCVNSTEFYDVTTHNKSMTVIKEPSPINLGSTSALLISSGQVLVLGGKSDELYCFDCETTSWKRELHRDIAGGNRQVCKLGNVAKGSKLFRLSN